MCAPRERDNERRDTGASAVEYALLIAGVAIALLLVVGYLGASLIGTFEDSSESVAVSLEQ